MDMTLADVVGHKMKKSKSKIKGSRYPTQENTTQENSNQTKNPTICKIK